MNHADWLKNYVVKMASSSVKRGDDLQIFTVNSILFVAVMKNDTFMFLAVSYSDRLLSVVCLTQGSTLTKISTCPLDKFPPFITCPNAYFTCPTLNKTHCFL
jgi:hypothetical protein